MINFTAFCLVFALQAAAPAAWAKEAAEVGELRLELEKTQQELVNRRYIGQEEAKSWQLEIVDINMRLRLSENRQKILKKELAIWQEKEQARAITQDEEREQWQKLIAAWQKDLAEKRCFGVKEIREQLAEVAQKLQQKELTSKEAAYLLSALLLRFHERGQQIFAGPELLTISGQTFLAETVNFGDTLLYYRLNERYGYLYHDKSGCKEREFTPEAVLEQQFIDNLFKLCRVANCATVDKLLLPPPGQLLAP